MDFHKFVFFEFRKLIYFMGGRFLSHVFSIVKKKLTARPTQPGKAWSKLFKPGEANQHGIGRGMNSLQIDGGIVEIMESLFRRSVGRGQPRC